MNPLVVTRRVLCTVMLGALAVLVVGGVVRPPDEPSTWLRLALAAYVGVLGWLVAGYAATNLRGQARATRFAVLLVVAVGGLLTMVSADDLVLSAIGWTVSGAATAALVAHRGDAAARRAARVVASRLAWGDAALWLAVAVVLAGGGSQVGTALASVLLAIAVLVRSASVPVQRWLPETAEAPSPVSALLHAGVVNGGAMFALVHWSVLAASPGALVVLVAAGVVSVAAGLTALRLRPDVKGRLAGSTTAQMGLVAVQLGLGLPAAALLHVLGHGCWKAWLFLRAGGAVDRARTATGGSDGPARVHPALVVGAVVGVGLAVGTAAPGLALPAALTTAVAVVALAEVRRLRRTGRGARVLAGVLAVGVPAAYVGLVALVDPVVHGAFDRGPASAAHPVLAAAAAALVVGIGLAASRLTPGSSGPVATAAAATLLPPGASMPGRVRPAATEPSVLPGGLPPHQLGTVVAIAATTVGPAWPLRSLVAANPLAPLEKLAVEDAAATVRILHGRDPRPALSTFLDLHAQGLVSDSAVRRSLAEQEPAGGGSLSGASPTDLVTFTRACAARVPAGGPAVAPVPVRACDRITVRRGRRPGEVLDLHVAAWAARAWGSASVDGSSPQDPWSLWLASARHRTYDVAWRMPGTSVLTRSLPDDPAAAIAALWPQVGTLVGETDLYTYLAATFAAGRGWAAHACWRDRASEDAGALLQLVALALALDVVIARAALDGRGGRVAAPVPSDGARDEDAATTAYLVGVWQRALDLTTRDGVLRDLAAAPSSAPQGGAAPEAAATAGRVHSVWCIDARSERIRRHLEARGGHETYGYAGFFGVAARHRDASGAVVDLCPGILRPAVTTEERPSLLGTSTAVRQLAGRIGQHPAAAFGWAEMSGVPALLGTVGATLAPGRWRALTEPARPAVPPELGPLPHEVAVETAAQLLVATGLVARLGDGSSGPEPLVVVGHGSSTENNAFASAYDCGACGGNSGRVNAVLAATALNDPLVRVALAERGLVVPDSVVAVAAVHDTTTDRVVLLRRSAEEPPELAAVLDALVDDLARAGGATSTERAAALPTAGRRRRRSGIVDRGADWAESMPEWGLAGARALVVGPRRLTAGRDLGGATFLHSYDAGLDPDGRVLEQIMTGPLVVTHWISAQYYFSAAAPDLLGAGDKTTHNVVGDVGVLTGAHGDLRVGLPWQAVAGRDPGPDGAATDLRHVPARHLVVLAADPAHVRSIVTRHRQLWEMVGNGWAQLVVMDADGGFLELDRQLSWQRCWMPTGAPAAPARRPAAPADRSRSTAS
ncbi:putative inorganic carbon transporter subunit DabA [Nocardioides zeae]|nr:putative inorganic carbon transporter subunit DabA [Nocardioides zeae]